jgi:glucose-6-phosphate 1-dehydrogenase
MKKSIHQHQDIPPTILTIFGATGDLSSDYLLPALLHMDEEGMLPKDFKLVCVGRRDLTAKAYLDFIIKKSSVLKKIPSKTKQHFLKRLIYFKGNFEDPASFVPLAKTLSDVEKPKHKCYNRLYYFATSPQFFSSIAHILKESGLLMSCEAHERKVRVLVEKPFGFNLESARALNKLLLKYFNEDQIYRIDHYQGKETVQNLMVVRFANRMFEPLWNKDHVDHIEISVLEKDSAKSRAEFYDQTGALKDFVQNHILQMLALIAMDEPKNLQTELIRDEKMKVLQSLVPFNLKSINSNLIRGQYLGYAKDVGHESDTETCVALKAFINSPRWQGVPVYIRTGKSLSKKKTEISIHFKELDRCLFKGCAANVITFRIQPDESVYFQINNKIPGFGIDLHQGLLEFGYKDAFVGELPGAYERLLLDFMQGDQRLFIRSDEIEAAWKFIDSITANWKDLPVYKYKPGANGPNEADDFIHKDGKEWWTR